MIHHCILDWDDAYANTPNIPGGERYPELWVEPAQSFRTDLLAKGRARIDVAYGPQARHKLDLFQPAGAAAGLVVFVHGGYWMKMDKSYFSMLAAGPLTRGWAVAVPSYNLCPDVSITEITREVGAAITSAAEMVTGPLCLTGHSAGGHLAARMVTSTSPLPEAVRARIRHTLSISGVHDLRPLLRTAMNATLKLDEAEAQRESPALLLPLPGMRLTCWVGAAERSEFIRQNALLANAWTGVGAQTASVQEPDRHHFNVIDGLREARSALTTALLGET